MGSGAIGVDHSVTVEERTRASPGALRAPLRESVNCVGKAGGEGSGASAEVLLDDFGGAGRNHLTAGVDWKVGSSNSWPFRGIGVLFWERDRMKSSSRIITITQIWK